MIKRLAIFFGLLCLTSEVNAAFPITPVIISTNVLQSGTTVYVSSLTATTANFGAATFGSFISTTTPIVVTGTSVTITSPFQVSGSSTAIFVSTPVFNNPIYSMVAITNQSQNSGTSFVNCNTTATVTNPGTSNIPLQLMASFDIGNAACAGGGNGLVWILEDGGFILGENSTTPRYSIAVIGSNKLMATTLDVVTGVTPGAHNFCLGFAGAIGGCGTTIINGNSTTENFIVKQL